MVEHLSNAPGPVVVVDNTSSQEAAETYPEMLKRGMNIVTPNKKGFSGSAELWRDIFESTSSNDSGSGRGRVLVFHESTVGAGLPIISTLKDLVETGDEIRKIEGVFSGTMSFLFNNFAPIGGGGGTFSAEVKKAKDLGYTVRFGTLPPTSSFLSLKPPFPPFSRLKPSDTDLPPHPYLLFHDMFQRNPIRAMISTD